MTGPSRGADRTEIHEIGEPRPGPGEVCIDVAYAGINFVDVMARRGDAAYASAWPYAPGLEVSGTVRETGPGVTELALGQQVAAFTAGGGLAAVARTRAEFMVPVPGQLSLAVAAAAPLMLTTGLLLLSDAARFRPGESVLVHSASGGVGSAIAQLVPALGGGLRIGTVGRPGKVASALANGYDVAMARTGDVAGAVREATGGAGADIVLDPLGTAMLETDPALTAPGGRIVLFGNAGGGGAGSAAAARAADRRQPRHRRLQHQPLVGHRAALGWSADPASGGRTPRPRGRGQRDHRRAVGVASSPHRDLVPGSGARFPVLLDAKSVPGALRPSAGRDAQDRQPGPRASQVQPGLDEPERPEDDHVEPVLVRDEPLDRADLGVGEDLGHGGHLLTAQPAARRADRYPDLRIAADALDLAGGGVGLHQELAVPLDEPYRGGDALAVALVTGDAEVPAAE
jgi:NADPH:quinone reductase